MQFQFVCDARVSTVITAGTYAEARKEWQQFCERFDASEEFCADKVITPFEVSLDQVDPEVYDAETGDDLFSHAPRCPYLLGGECECHRLQVPDLP